MFLLSLLFHTNDWIGYVLIIKTFIYFDVYTYTAGGVVFIKDETCEVMLMFLYFLIWINLIACSSKATLAVRTWQFAAVSSNLFCVWLIWLFLDGQNFAKKTWCLFLSMGPFSFPHLYDSGKFAILVHWLAKSTRSILS